jgi:hypothetical protein
VLVAATANAPAPVVLKKSRLVMSQFLFFDMFATKRTLGNVKEEQVTLKGHNREQRTVQNLVCLRQQPFFGELVQGHTPFFLIAKSLRQHHVEAGCFRN